MGSSLDIAAAALAEGFCGCSVREGRDIDAQSSSLCDVLTAGGLTKMFWKSIAK